MPRYSEVETIVFQNYDGKNYQIKDIRPISNQTIAFSIDKDENELLDEVASRKSVFGDFGESKSWRIFDLNIKEIYKADFDLTKIVRLKIPVQ